MLNTGDPLRTTLAATDKRRLQGGLLVVFGSLFFTLIALGFITLSIILPLHTSASLDDIVQNTLLPRVRSGFEESNQAIEKELDTLKQTLVGRTGDSFAKGFKAKAGTLAKSVVPYIENYFFDSTKEAIEKEMKSDTRIAAIRYKLRESDKPEIIGNAAGDLMAFKSPPDKALRGVEIAILVSREVLAQMQSAEEASITRIEMHLSAASHALEQRILEDTDAQQDSVIMALVRDIWLLSIVLCALIVGISIWLIRSKVLIPLRQTQAHLEALAQGDLRADLDDASRNELGDMARAMNSMVANLRRIVSHIHESVTTVATHSQHLASSTQKLAQGAHTQTGMAQSFIEVAKNTADASNTARASNELAVSGRSLVVETATGMSAIAGKTSESSTLIEELGRAARRSVPSST